MSSASLKLPSRRKSNCSHSFRSFSAQMLTGSLLLKVSAISVGNTLGEKNICDFFLSFGYVKQIPSANRSMSMFLRRRFVSMQSKKIKQIFHENLILSPKSQKLFCLTQISPKIFFFSKIGRIFFGQHLGPY